MYIHTYDTYMNTYAYIVTDRKKHKNMFERSVYMCFVSLFWRESNMLLINFLVMHSVMRNSLKGKINLLCIAYIFQTAYLHGNP